MKRILDDADSTEMKEKAEDWLKNYFTLGESSFD